MFRHAEPAAACGGSENLRITGGAAAGLRDTAAIRRKLPLPRFAKFLAKRLDCIPLIFSVQRSLALEEPRKLARHGVSGFRLKMICPERTTETVRRPSRDFLSF